MKFNARNVFISPKAKIGQNVRIGDDTVIYDHVEIGDNSVIANNCVIGEPVSTYYENPDRHTNQKTIIGPNSLIRSHAIIYESCLIGSHFSTGHRIVIRENTSIGDYCKIGSGSDLQGYLSLGNDCQLHSNVHLCQYSKLGDFVFIYPNVVLGNDKHPPSETVAAPNIGNFVQIGIQSSIIGGISIGENSLIGANALVLHDFEAFSLILGSPAKRANDVRELRSENGDRLYPWKNRFKRGMPWTEDQ